MKSTTLANALVAFLCFSLPFTGSTQDTYELLLKYSRQIADMYSGVFVVPAGAGECDRNTVLCAHCPGDCCNYCPENSVYDFPIDPDKRSGSFELPNHVRIGENADIYIEPKEGRPRKITDDWIKPGENEVKIDLRDLD